MVPVLRVRSMFPMPASPDRQPLPPVSGSPALRVLSVDLTPSWSSAALLLIECAYLSELPLWFRVRPTVSRWFPHCVAHYPYLLPELPFSRNQQGLPSS